MNKDNKSVDLNMKSKDSLIDCNCCQGDEAIWWQNDMYNAFIDRNGEMQVTVNGYTKCFYVEYCPRCGKKLRAND